MWILGHISRKPAGRHDPRALRGEFQRHCRQTTSSPSPVDHLFKLEKGMGLQKGIDNNLDDAVLNQGPGKHERHQEVAAVDDQ